MQAVLDRTIGQLASHRPRSMLFCFRHLVPHFRSGSSPKYPIVKSNMLEKKIPGVLWVEDESFDEAS